jgi:hypothetical protein
MSEEVRKELQINTITDLTSDYRHTWRKYVERLEQNRIPPPPKWVSNYGPDRFWSPPSLLFNGYQGLFPWR